jgi:hypothetical protein
MKPELADKLREDFPLFAKGGFHGRGLSFDCGNGWYKLIRELGERLSEIPDCPPPVQLKEKFGEMRIYLCAYPRDTDEIIADIEDRSRTTCERCSRPGKIRDTGWIRCYCDDCYKQWEKLTEGSAEFINEVEMT